MVDMEAIDKWVAEFFIRRKTNPRVSPTNLLSALKLGDSPDDCSNLNLKKASVLRQISDSLIRGDVDEETLDLLETLEKLLLQGEGSMLTESHKSAYCWTAVECAARFMWPLSVSEGLYEDALERIWTKRIRVLKGSRSGLVSGELLKWEDDMRKAVEDAEVYMRIRESNVRYTAVCFLNRLLEEQWAVLGSSSLESVAQRLLLLKRGEAGDKGDGGCGGGGDNRDVHGVENDEQHGAEEERTMGAQEQEQEASVDKGDKMAARHLKDYLLEIQRQIEPSTTRQVPVPNTPQASRVNRTGTSSQQQDNASEKSWSRVRPRLPTPVPLNVSPLNKKKKASPLPRRKKNFWRLEEVEALREGVKKHGTSWKYIKSLNPVVFAERTEVDLKDKWRNMNR